MCVVYNSNGVEFIQNFDFISQLSRNIFKAEFLPVVV